MHPAVQSIQASLAIQAGINGPRTGVSKKQLSVRADHAPHDDGLSKRDNINITFWKPPSGYP